MKLVTAAQMREIDRRSIEERGIPALRLMDAAGRAIAMDVCDHFETGSVAILCGKGNNGGDGFVAALYLANAAWRVSVIPIEEPTAGPARDALVRLAGIDGVTLFPVAEIGNLSEFIASHDVAVDALLGTGTTGAPRAPYDAAIRDLNAARIPVFSADIPSGLHPDTGDAENAVRAYRTITMGLPKLGMVSGNGPDACGGVRVEPLEFPRDLLDDIESQNHTLTAGDAAALLPARPASGHKGTFGLVTVIAGSAAMPGAAVLCGIGALRGGCGLVRMVCPGDVRPIAAAALPEALHSLACHHRHHLAHLDAEGIEDIFVGSDALVIGPGLGKGHETHVALALLLANHDLPMVLDADALNMLASDSSLQKLLGPRHVLTPHPGELARLLGKSIAQIQSNRWASAREAATRLGAIVLLKGRGTIVAEPSGIATHVGSGNTALARGGAGDLLAGLIGSLLAQGAPPADAAKLGAFVHGLAADVLAREVSPRGITIRDVADRIPAAFRELERTPPPA